VLWRFASINVARLCLKDFSTAFVLLPAMTLVNLLFQRKLLRALYEGFQATTVLNSGFPLLYRQRSNWFLFNALSETAL